MKSILVTLVLLSTIAISLMAIMHRADAHEPTEPRHNIFSSSLFMHNKMDRMATALELSDDQRDAIDTLWKSQRDRMKTEHQTIHASRQAFHQAITRTPYDAAQIEHLAKEMSTQMSTLLVAHAKHFRHMYELLTPEQQAKLQQLHEKRLERKKRHFTKRNK